MNRPMIAPTSSKLMDSTMGPAAVEVPASRSIFGQAIPARCLEVTAGMGRASEGDVIEMIATVECPYCRRLPGQYCVDPKSRRPERVHATRVNRFRRRFPR